jgi:hypothetical protein
MKKSDEKIDKKDSNKRYVPDIKDLLSDKMPKDFYKEAVKVNRLWSELQKKIKITP